MAIGDGGNISRNSNFTGIKFIQNLIHLTSAGVRDFTVAIGTVGVLNALVRSACDDDAWRDQVLRCAEKLGRPVRDCAQLLPAADFPSRDGRPPLKTLILRF